MAEWKKIIVSGSVAELEALTTDKDITSDGYFVGDGSKLTNVPAASINIDVLTDGTSITVAGTDKLLLSDGGTEKKINVSQLPFTAANVTTNLSEGTTTNTTVDVNSSDGTNATLASASTTRAGLLSKAKFDEIELNNKKTSDINHNVTTNLAEGTATNTTVKVTSSDGTDATLNSASTSRAGLLSKAKFDEIVANTLKTSDINHNVTTNLTTKLSATAVEIDSSDGTNASIGAADTTNAGIMTKAIFDEHVLNNAKVSDVNHNVSTDLSTTLSATAVRINSSDGTNASIGAATTTNAGIMTKAIFDEHELNNKKASNVGTDLSKTLSATTVSINSSDGTNVSIGAADTTNAGIMTKAMYDNHILNNVKVSNVGTDLSTTLSATEVHVNSSDGTNAKIGAATTTNAGIMTKAIFDEHELNNKKITNTDVNVSIANLKTKLAGGFGSNAVQIGDANDVVTIGNKLVVTGDLLVSGTTTTVDTDNLNVKDKFINLNDGGSAADGGIVVEGAGTSFGWDNSAGRWAFDFSGATEGQTTIASDAFAVAVHASADSTFKPEANYEKNGNVYVAAGELYMYVE